MHTCHGIENCPKHESSVLTMGTFDGVHKGHRRLIDELIARAKQYHLPAVLLTFHPHPQHVLKPHFDIPLRLLTTIEEKEKLLKELGVDYFVIIPFNRKISRLSAEEFLEKLILPNLKPRHFIIGHDHHFGKGRSGDRNLLKSYGDQHGFGVSVIHAVQEKNLRISSTAIRQLLREGEIEKCNQLLGYEYLLIGTVVRGDSRGHNLGFPTANIKPLNTRKQFPARGVYLVRVKVEDRVNFGMCNVGIRPTFGGEKEIIEVNILYENNSTEKNINLYDKKIELNFLKRIREEKKFASPQALMEQLHKDRNQCKKLIKQL